MTGLPTRTAIITGGAKRIGGAITRALAADGWYVLIHCNQSRAEAEAIGTTSTENERGTPQNASRVGVVSSTRSISPKQQRNVKTTRPRHTSGAAAEQNGGEFRQSASGAGSGRSRTPGPPC